MGLPPAVLAHLQVPTAVSDGLAILIAESALRLMLQRAFFCFWLGWCLGGGGDAWLVHAMLALLFPSHLRRIGGVEAAAVFACGEHYPSFIHQIYQVGKGFSQRIEFLVDGPFVPVGVLPRGIACDVDQAGMAVDHQLVQFFQSVSVEAFQEIDALGNPREGAAVPGQNKINV